MENSKKSQILKVCLIASLFFTTPLIPKMFRSTYLYLILNLLIVSLCAEAGLASFFTKSDEEKKQFDTMVANSPKILVNDNKTHESKYIVKANIMVLEKCSSEKIMVGTVRVVSKVKKCPSTPSIFFIGNGKSDTEESLIEEYEEENEVVRGQELFTKAELFIGKFHKQLKMQRQNSWNRIHGFLPKGSMI